MLELIWEIIIPNKYQSAWKQWRRNFKRSLKFIYQHAKPTVFVIFFLGALAGWQGNSRINDILNQYAKNKQVDPDGLYQFGEKVCVTTKYQFSFSHDLIIFDGNVRCQRPLNFNDKLKFRDFILSCNPAMGAGQGTAGEIHSMTYFSPISCRILEKT